MIDPHHRLTTRVAGLVVLAAALGGCSADTNPPSTPPTSQPVTYHLDPRPVRPGETPLRLPTTVEGDTSFTLIGLTTGMPSLVGSHIEFPAKGQFVRVRLVITNVGRSSVLFDSRRQQLVLDDGSARAPDDQAMLVKRQATTFDLGSAVRVEFDLYYDIPVGAKPTALRVFGGATLTDMRDEQGTDIALG
jgi:hypothetical protein